MSKRKLSALVIPLQGDSSGFRKELLRARSEAAKETATIGQSFQQLGKRINSNQGNLKLVTDEFSRFGGVASGALSNIQGLLGNLGGALASGGPILAGVTAISLGIGALVTKIKEARDEAQKLEALHIVTGISSQEVSRLRDELDKVGVSLSKVEAGTLAKVAQEAKLSKEEILGNAEAIRALATLEGLSFDSAAVKFFEELKKGAEDTAALIQSISDAIHNMEHGPDDPILAAGEARIKALQEEKEELRNTLQAYQDAEEAAYRAMISRPTLANQRAYADARRIREQAEAGPQGERFTTGIDQEIRLIEDRLVAYQLEKDARDEAKKADEAARKAAQEANKAAQEAAKKRAKLAQEAEARDKQALETAINAARARGDQEAVINLELEKRIGLLKSLHDRNLISDEDLETEIGLAEEEAEQKRQAILAASLEKQYELELAHRQRLASLTESRLDDLEIQLEQELRSIEKQLEQEVLSVQQAETEKARIREYFAELRRIAEEEEAARAQAKRDAELASAFNVGFGAASSMSQGIAEGLKTGQASSAIKGLFGVLSLVGGIIGGPAVGAAISGFTGLFAGFFSEGGYVNGPRSSKRDNLIARVEAGEFIVNRDATARHRGLLEAINSGNAALVGSFASGGLVGASSPVPAAAPVNNIYIASLDPKQTADVLAHRIEPAQRRRGLSRADAAYISTVRTRINRRSGRN